MRPFEHKGWMCKVGWMVALLVFLGGCATAKPSAPKVNTAQYHHHMGMKYLEEGELEKAYFEFQEGKTLDAKYWQNYQGSALVAAVKGDFEAAEKDAEVVKKLAKNQPAPHLLYARIYLLKGEPEKAEKRLKEALEKEPNSAEAYYFLGKVKAMVRAYDEAMNHYQKALFLNPHFGPAERELERLQKIKMAAPHSQIAKDIALLDRITRADLAALLIAELDIDKRLQRQTSVLEKPDATMSPPPYIQRADASPQKHLSAPDIEGHWAEASIKRVMASGLMKLNGYGGFEPNRPLNRAEMAEVVQRVLIAKTDNTALANFFKGAKSPFEDIREGQPFFNAVLLTVSREFMEARPDGTFGPATSVSGAEALLCLARLNETLDQLEQ